MNFVAKKTTNYSIDLFIKWSRDLYRSCVADEYLYLFST